MVLCHIVQGAIILIYLQHIYWNKFNILKKNQNLNKKYEKLSHAYTYCGMCYNYIVQLF
jgi:hypothetical protein